MVAYKVREDIGNRALQHCGAQRMGPLGFSEASKNASEISFVYDKVREAELRARVWTFATRRTILRAVDDNTMLLVPALWSQVTTYFRGSIVADQSGDFWISNIPNNRGNDPLLTNFWEPYFGPMAVPLYDATATTTYSAGEVVYTAAGNGLSLVYLSLQDGNADVPGTATTYDPTVTYFKNQVVTFNAIAYMSLIDLNLNNEPDLAPALFNLATTYSAGQKVGGSDGVIYQSIGNGNIGNDPTQDGGMHWTNTGILNPWTTVFVGGAGSDKWLLIGGAPFPSGVGLTTLNIVYPVGTGPSNQQTTRNVFVLPAGYLRKANQNPKSGLNWLGGPTGIGYSDWVFENGFLISGYPGPIPLRFVANVTDVSRMDPMFCEGVAARIGLEVCETLTNSSAKLGVIGKIYEKWIDDAGVVDAIEDDFEDSPDDDYITVRL